MILQNINTTKAKTNRETSSLEINFNILVNFFNIYLFKKQANTFD